MKNRILALTLATIMALTPTTLTAQTSDITVIVNGEQIQFQDQQPIIIDGSTMVPVRGVFEALGYEVEWRENQWGNNYIRIDGGMSQSRLYFSPRSAWGTHWGDGFGRDGFGRPVMLVPTPENIHGRVMIPLRAISETFGHEVQWDGDTRTVTIVAGIIEIGGVNFSTSWRTLDLSDRGLTDEDIAPLRYMTNLSILDLSGNQISDLSPLTGLTNLTNLNLDRNNITDLTPLTSLTNLTRLSLSNNLIRDWLPVAHIANVVRGNQIISSITLPNRRVTDAERREWIDDYWAHGGPTATELEVVRLVNIERANHGLSRVEIDDTLMMAARFFAQQAHDLRGFHTGTHNFGPYATNPSARHGASANVAAAFGANLRWNGGNWFSGGSLSAEFLVNGWMNSDGHRRYILSPEHRFIGMGQFPGGISYLFLSDRASN